MRAVAVVGLCCATQERSATLDSTIAILALTARIVSAHISRNPVAVEALPPLIGAVHRALATVGQAVEAPPAPPTPAVPIRKSVFPDHIVCLEDGRKLKTLKRYLQARYGMTPAAYRARWNLPADYPMVAPNYTKRRSDLAKARGLGRRPSLASQPAEPEQASEPEATVPPTRRARGVKA